MNSGSLAHCLSACLPCTSSSLIRTASTTFFRVLFERNRQTSKAVLRLAFPDYLPTHPNLCTTTTTTITSFHPLGPPKNIPSHALLSEQASPTTNQSEAVNQRGVAPSTSSLPQRQQSIRLLATVFPGTSLTTSTSSPIQIPIPIPIIHLNPACQPRPDTPLYTCPFSFANSPFRCT